MLRSVIGGVRRDDRVTGELDDAAFAALAWARELAPTVLPPTWRVATERGDGKAYMRADGLSVILSAAVEQDGRRWLHVSLARRTRLPSWDDVRQVKELFIGRDRPAVQVLPAASRYINIHPHCLHLWSCLDGDPLPDFARGGETI